MTARAVLQTRRCMPEPSWRTCMINGRSTLHRSWIARPDELLYSNTMILQAIIPPPTVATVVPLKHHRGHHRCAGASSRGEAEKVDDYDLYANILAIDAPCSGNIFEQCQGFTGCTAVTRAMLPSEDRYVATRAKRLRGGSPCNLVDGMGK